MRIPGAKIDVRGYGAAAACLAFGWLMLMSPLALAQDEPRPSEQAAPAQPAPVGNPGLFESVGRWLDEGAAKFRAHVSGAKQRADSLSDQAAADRKIFDKNAAEAGKAAAEFTKGAADAVAKIPVARAMSGHERCTVAPNGAPDCLAAAETLCRKHGFASGKSIDFTSAEECPARALLAGRRSGDECTTVTFISRAMCQ
jgi:hypothetical protein